MLKKDMDNSDCLSVNPVALFESVLPGGTTVSQAWKQQPLNRCRFNAPLVSCYLYLMCLICLAVSANSSFVGGERAVEEEK